MRTSSKSLLIISLLLFLCPAGHVAGETGHPDWWDNTHVPAFTGRIVSTMIWGPGPPLNHSLQEYKEIYSRCGVSIAGWADSRYTGENYPIYFQQYVDMMHEWGLSVIGTLSILSAYQESSVEPERYLAAVLTDPYGNRVTDRFGLDPSVPISPYVHSMHHPTWLSYLLDHMKFLIDAGVEGLVMDELAYGSFYHPDFNDYTVQSFPAYMKATYRQDQLDQKGRLYGIKDWDHFDYGAFIKKYLPAETTHLTTDDWNGGTGIVPWDTPLLADYQRFLRVINREAARYLLTQARQYALSKYNRKLSVAVNLNDLYFDGLYMVDLIDWIEMESFYVDENYFPNARALSALKFAHALGKKAQLQTSYLRTRPDIVQRGKNHTVNLYKTMIADAYAGGGAFYVEEGSHDVSQDIDALSSYYRFAQKNPNLFKDVTPVRGEFGVLRLWEALDPHEGRAFSGIANLLADLGYQFSVVFGAENFETHGIPYRHLAPSGKRLHLDQLVPYGALIVPFLNDIIESHAQILLQYVKQGGKLFVFSTGATLDLIDARRGENPAVAELIRHCSTGKVNVGAGRIVATKQIYGTAYMDHINRESQDQFRQLLEKEGLFPEVKMQKGKFLSALAYQKPGHLIIHFVNYDYNLDRDTTTPMASTPVDILLPDGMSAQHLRARFISPEQPVQELSFVTMGRNIQLTLPQVDIWGILSLQTKLPNDCAQFFADTQALRIPCLDLGDQYWIDLKLSDAKSLLFELGGFGMSGGSSNCARFDAQIATIHVPCLELAGTAYWIDLKIVQSAPVNLQLERFGPKE